MRTITPKPQSVVGRIIAKKCRCTRSVLWLHEQTQTQWSLISKNSVRRAWGLLTDIYPKKEMKSQERLWLAEFGSQASPVLQLGRATDWQPPKPIEKGSYPEANWWTRSAKRGRWTCRDLCALEFIILNAEACPFRNEVKFPTSCAIETWWLQDPVRLERSGFRLTGSHWVLPQPSKRSAGADSQVAHQTGGRNKWSVQPNKCSI